MPTPEDMQRVSFLVSAMFGGMCLITWYVEIWRRK